MNGVQIIGFLIDFVLILSNFISYAIIGRIIVSWVSSGSGGARGGRLGSMLFDITEPFINVARKIPHRWGMFDFAPLIALIGIDLLATLIVVFLSNLA